MGAALSVELTVNANMGCAQALITTEKRDNKSVYSRNVISFSVGFKYKHRPQAATNKFLCCLELYQRFFLLPFCNRSVGECAPL